MCLTARPDNLRLMKKKTGVSDVPKTFWKAIHGQGQVNHDRETRQRPHGPATISTHPFVGRVFHPLSTQRANSRQCPKMLQCLPQVLIVPRLKCWPFTTFAPFHVAAEMLFVAFRNNRGPKPVPIRSTFGRNRSAAVLQMIRCDSPLASVSMYGHSRKMNSVFYEAVE